MSEPSIKTVVKRLEKYYIDDIMSEWESEFYESVTVQMQNGPELTEKQIDKILELYRQYCV